MATDQDRLTSLIVSDQDDGLRLDKWLAKELGQASRTQIQRLIAQGHIQIDGKAVTTPSLKTKRGQQVEVAQPAAVELDVEAEAIPFDILFEDEHVIVLDKPAGLVVHPAPGHQGGTLVNAILAHCGPGLKGIGGVKRPGIVHRLDKGTSGIMVVAKTQAAYDGLAPQFADHSIERAYRALVWRAPKSAKGTIETQIGRSPTNRKKMAVLTKGGRRAVTHYTVDRVFEFGGKATASVLTCRLETGRTHQIRVHLTHLGHPIVGDPQYGRGHASILRTLPPSIGEKIREIGRPCLHAAVLGFEHPVFKTPLSFSAPLPSDITTILEAFEGLETPC